MESDDLVTEIIVDHRRGPKVITRVHRNGKGNASLDLTTILLSRRTPTVLQERVTLYGHVQLRKGFETFRGHGHSPWLLRGQTDS